MKNEPKNKDARSKKKNKEKKEKKPKKSRVEQIVYAVIAGELKGVRLSVPDLGITRPPLTRLRKSIFDFLNPYLEEAAYLDLFCGTGSYLFEAVSRRVAQAVGVERESQLAEAINQQAVKNGVGDRLACRCQDVFEAIGELYSRGVLFDVIMIAPPQYLGLVDKTLAELKKHPLIKPGGIILCQHDSSETRKINLYGFELNQHRKYGNTTYTILGGKNSEI